VDGDFHQKLILIFINGHKTAMYTLHLQTNVKGVSGVMSLADDV
jgi:hypothetical protein